MEVCPWLPLHKKYDGGDVKTLQLPRNKEYEIYDFIKDECQAIQSMLPESREGEDLYRATRYAAYALECRAMLYAASEAKYGNVDLNGLIGIPAEKAEGYWKAAKAAAEKIINSGKYALYTAKTDKAENFQYLFLRRERGQQRADFHQGFRHL